jgi:fatty acid desaturase
MKRTILLAFAVALSVFVSTGFIFPTIISADWIPAWLIVVVCFFLFLVITLVFEHIIMKMFYKKVKENASK